MADEFDEKATELLPHYGANHGIIAGAVCPCTLRDAVAQALREGATIGARWMIICPDCHGSKSRDVETATYSGHATCPDCGGTGRQLATTIVAQAKAQGFAEGVEHVAQCFELAGDKRVAASIRNLKLDALVPTPAEKEPNGL